MIMIFELAPRGEFLMQSHVLGFERENLFAGHALYVHLRDLKATYLRDSKKKKSLDVSQTFYHSLIALPSLFASSGGT
jgi:hypothetical protein